MCKKIATIVRKTYRMVPNGGRGCSVPTPGRSRGLPPSPSARINNSMSGGIPVSCSANSRGIGRTNVPTMVSPKAASTRPTYGRGRDSRRNHHIPAGVTQSKVLGQGGMQLMANSSKPSSGPALGRGRIAAAALPKVPSKRKRPSKKLPIEIINATEREFRATVQELTGYKEPPVPVVVRPQPERARPERPQGDAVPINVGLDSFEYPPARVDSSSTSMISAVHSPTPVSDRVPEAPFFMPDSSTCDSSSLNDCMGYGLNTPRFLESSYDENLGQLPDSIQTASSEYDCHISEPMKHKKREGSTTTASPITVSVKEVVVLPSEGNGREGIPREQVCSGTNFDSGWPHHGTRQSPFLVLDNRYEETSYFGMESDPDDDSLTRMAYSFLNDCQSNFQ